MNIIMILFLLFIGIACFSLLTKGLWPRINRRLTWKNNLLLAGAYLVLLFLLVPLSALIPQDDFVRSSKDGDKELFITQAPRDWSADSRKYHIPLDGHFDEQSGLYKNSSQSFQMDTNQLTLVGSANTGYERIFIERKDSEDGEIEVSSYVAPHYADAVDFTRMVSPPKISFEKGTMTIEAPSQQNLVFKNESDSFTVGQFKPNNQNARKGNASIFGGKAIHIRIPKNLEIHDEGFQGQINWVNDQIKMVGRSQKS